MGKHRITIALLILLLLAFAFALPRPLFNEPLSPVLYDRKGVMLGARVASDGQWRFAPDPASPVNPQFARALVTYEDRRFYRHPGFDPLAVVRAIQQNAASGSVVSGASTITMQTVRLMRQSRRRLKDKAPPSRNIAEKALETILAVRLELGRSKDDILALYSAHAPFGGNVVGLDAAAWRWFGRSPHDLSWAEAATLAVLPNSPGLVRPGKNEELLRAKRDALLRRLHSQGAFDGETLSLSLAESLPGLPKSLPDLAPHYLERAIAEGIPTPILSTLDEALQVHAKTVVDRFAASFRRNLINNAACLILDNATGEPLAYVVSGADLDLAMRPRSSGSTLKPFLYAAMLDSGELMPQELVSDIPTRINGYRPENNVNTYAGAVPADQALTRSLNVPAVRELARYGVPRFAAFLQDLGITTLWRAPGDYGLPLILGGAEVTLWELAGLYRDLALAAQGEGGSRPPGSHFVAPTPPTSGARPPNPQDLRQSTGLSRGAAYLTLEALTGGQRPDDEYAWQNYAGSQRIAWKTGTSFGLRDAWCIGVTPQWTVAVWVGNASGEGRPELRGGVTAAPLMFEIFSFLNTGPWFAPPPRTELISVASCGASGLPPGPNCAAVTTTAIPAQAPRRDPCPYCRTIEGEKWFVLTPAEEWYYRRWKRDYPSPPHSGDFPLALFNPEEGGLVYVPVELDGSPGRLVLQAAHRDSRARLFWHLDGAFLAVTQDFHEIEVRPAPGPHTLLIQDPAGATLTRRFFTQ